MLEDSSKPCGRDGLKQRQRCVIGTSGDSLRIDLSRGKLLRCLLNNTLMRCGWRVYRR